ncbi:Ig-like domain repeat protein [Dorea sp.]
MGRKIKKAITVVTAGMIIGSQFADMSAVGSIVRAEAGDHREAAKKADPEEDKDENKDPEEDKDPEEGKDLEEGKDPEEDKDPDKDSEKEDKDPEEESEKEAIKPYRIVYNEPDGENGYYIHCPDGRITHMSKRGTTRYLFKNGNNEQQEGILDRQNESFLLKQLNFTDGGNELKIWMEDEKGHRVENSESQKEFWLDSSRPVVHYEITGGSEIWHKDNAEVRIESSDGVNGSQIAEIICKTGEKVIGKSNKEMETFRIEEESKNGEGIPVTFIVKDVAGNKTVVTDKVCIDRNVPEAAIQGVQDYMITSKPVKVNYLAEEENIFQVVQAHVSKEDITGRKEETEITEWQMGKSDESGKMRKESSQTLTEDGIYKLRMNVTDMAGHENQVERQVIIDKENPVIVHVDELDGRYLKYFRWDYPAGESVKDFTSYTYTMKLDDTVYRPGEKIEKEGMHTLVVEAVDSAGNKSDARARFTIDHTPPVIRFENIREGESYEKERQFYIRTENPEDQIEYIKINGAKQKSEKQKGLYECKVDEAKAYEVEVKAKDLAGNEQISRIGFQVEQEKTLLQKITEPVKKYIFYGNEKAIKEEEQLKEGRMNKRNGKNILCSGIMLTGILTGISFWNILKKMKSDNKNK